MKTKALLAAAASKKITTIAMDLLFLPPLTAEQELELKALDVQPGGKKQSF
jgi:hypothetical protein